MDFDSSVRKAIYELTRGTGRPPTTGELAAAAGADTAEIHAALQRLATARVVVTQPLSGELLMVPPFSAVPTPFVVTTRRYACYANCAWDAFGVPVMLHEDAEIRSACSCCGESLAFTAAADRRPRGDGVIHFAVPARRWWDDIVFT